MTRLDSAISYFTKGNKSPSGSLQKIYAYDLAEKSLRNMDEILQVFSSLHQDMITEKDALNKIALVLKTQ